MTGSASTPFPDGIDPAHVAPRGGPWRRWIAITLLATVMLAALFGVFGGGKVRPIVADAPAARLEVATPRVIRNGMFFETRVQITARQPIDKAVVTVSRSLWRDMTINTMIPAASDEAVKDAAFTFDYGPLAAGETLTIKIDGQINPPLFAGTKGRIALLDGERELVAAPIRITVLP